MILEKVRAPSGNEFHKGLGCEASEWPAEGWNLEGPRVVAVAAGVVVDVHLQHLLALRSLVRVLPRLRESIEVTFHPVATIEGVDTDDAELPLRGLPRESIVDPAISALTDWPRVVRHVYLLKVLFSTALLPQRLPVFHDSDNALNIAYYWLKVKPNKKLASLPFLI